MIKQGVDATTAEATRLGLIDLEAIEVDAGRVSGMTEAVSDLLKERPELKRSTMPSPGVANGAPGGNRSQASDPSTMNPEELRSMGDREFFNWCRANPHVEFKMGDGPSYGEHFAQPE